MVFKEWDRMDYNIKLILPFINKQIKKQLKSKEISDEQIIECVNRISLYHLTFNKEWLITGGHGLYDTIEFEDIQIHLPTLFRKERYNLANDLGNGVICVDEFGNTARMYFSSSLGKFSAHCPIISAYGNEEEVDLELAMNNVIQQYYQDHPNPLSATEIRNNFESIYGNPVSCRQRCR